MTKEQVLELIKIENVRYIRLQFSDLQGVIKAVEVPVSQINTVLENDVMFDGSSIEGLVRINESDMFLAPDLNSFKIIPWETALDGSKVAMFMCDILNVEKKPFVGDPRYILKRQVERMQKMGFDRFNIGLEPEFFMFKDVDPSNVKIQLTDTNGYFDMAPMDEANSCRREIVLQLEMMGFEIEASHHEVSESQHEINFKFDSALECCDNVQIFKLAVKTIAKKHGMLATFMPKPLFGINGSGMHANVSLFDKDGNNIFYEPERDNQLSETCEFFIGGLLKHATSFTAITNPLVNSYKRLVPGYEAPVYVTYSDSNRSAMIRIPATRKKATRVEVRSVDASANPYLAMAAILASGLDGIENKINPGSPEKLNLFRLTESERIEMGIDTLPKSLNAAVNQMQTDDLMRDVLGEHTFDLFIANKRMEYAEYSRQVHAWEVDNYLTRF